MVSTRQLTSMSTAYSYANRAEVVAAAVFDTVEAEEPTAEEATEAAHAAAAALVWTLAAHHGITQYR